MYLFTFLNLARNQKINQVLGNIDSHHSNFNVCKFQIFLTIILGSRINFFLTDVL